MREDLTDDTQGIAALLGDPDARHPLVRVFRAWLRGEALAETPPEQSASYARLVRRIDAMQQTRRGAERRGGSTPVLSGGFLGTRSLRLGRLPWRGVQSSRVWIAAVTCVIVGLMMRGITHPAEVTYRWQTKIAESMTVRLADGSSIVLAPSTSVTLTAHLATVTGQAAFSVIANAADPFLVQTHTAIVRVLGTHFSVRQYPNEPQSRVTVVGGRVAIQRRSHEMRASDGTVLSAQMMAMVSDSGIVVTSGITPRESIGWIQGTLVFNHVPLRDVVAELSRAYGADIQVPDSALARRPLVAEVQVRTEPLARVLGIITATMDAHYVRHGGTYVLTSGRGEHVTPPQSQQDSLFPQPEKAYGR